MKLKSPEKFLPLLAFFAQEENKVVSMQVTKVSADNALTVTNSDKTISLVIEVEEPVENLALVKSIGISLDSGEIAVESVMEAVSTEAVEPEKQAKVKKPTGGVGCNRRFDAWS